MHGGNLKLISEFVCLFVYDGVTFLSDYEFRMFYRVVTSYHV